MPPLPSKDIVNAPDVCGLPWHNGYQSPRLRALRAPPWLTFAVPLIAHLPLNTTASSTATTGADTVDPWWPQTWYRGYAETAPSAFPQSEDSAIHGVSARSEIAAKSSEPPVSSDTCLLFVIQAYSL